MIIRISGGNDGVAEYLENGRKAERNFTRDELDHRLILDGNLDTTNKIIQSIDNTGQERYLHITLSFQESDVSHETLKAVTEEYKNLIMNAYDADEYCFYAEAHLPKIKNITDNATGKLVERKPHIHIVIPETNLVTGKKLLPTGKVTMTERYLDAIQEHVNFKYGLISPKDVTRVSDNNYANVLSRTKGDLYRERNSDFKKQILDSITKNNITSFSQFGHYLKNYGDVKLRNAGKGTQYYAVKLEGDAKYTNLKSPLFSQQYVEKRELQIVKPTEKQVSQLINDWQQRVSHEVKHIYPKSEAVRTAYKSLSDEDKKTFLKERIKSHEQERRLSTENGRKERQQRGFKQSSKPSLSRRANRLSYMPQRALVYGIRGSSRQPGRDWEGTGREASERLLPTHEHGNLGESGAESIHADQTVRWHDAGEQSEQSRGIKSIQESSVLHEEFFQHLNQNAQDNEIETMREVRDNIDPERFLSALSCEYQLIPSDYKISKSKNGSPRFQVGKRNMNASDFLTKHMNLSWADSKNILLKTYAEQQANIPFEKALTRVSLTKEQAKERFYSLKDTQKELKNILKILRSALYNEIKELRSQIYQVRGLEREVAHGLIVYHKLTGLETLSEMDKKGRNFITDYHAIWNKDKDPMKALQKLKKIIRSNEEENGVEPAETNLSIKSRVDAQKRIQELQKTRLKDLVLQKSQDKLVFLNPKSEKPVFTDKGVRLIANKDASNEEIALMLEYAKEKFGGVLKLNGDDEFKTKCALIAAEKDLNIIIKPEEFNNLMKQHKADLVANQIQQAEDDHTNAAPEQAVETGAGELSSDVPVMSQQANTAVDESHAVPAEISTGEPQVDHLDASQQEIYLVSHSIMSDENDGHIFHSKDDAMEYYKNCKANEINRYNLSGEFEDSTIISKIIPTEEISKYPDGFLGVFKTPYKVIANTYQEYQNEQREEHITVSSLISDYVQKAESEGLEFFVRDIEEDVSCKDMSVEEVREYLDKEIDLMRAVKADMHQDNENVQD